ncbi:MAG: molybdopterin-guanine dinucleotide biosynthesis protein B, partial [Desulfobacterales bacterium]
PSTLITVGSTPPLVSIVGNSGAGKTTLLEKLIAEVTQRGFRVGTIKHDVHGFEMDKPGKDSWRHKQAGAVTTLISSPKQIGMVMDVERDYRPDELIVLLSNVDIILAEGYKRAHHPKIELFRPEVYPEPLCEGDEDLIALVSNATIDLGVPRFSLEDISGVAEFLIGRFKL